MCRLNFLVVGVRIGILGLDAMGKLGVKLNITDKLVTLTGTNTKDSPQETGKARTVPLNVIMYGLYKAVTLNLAIRRSIYLGKI